jgi:serine/threonine protein phosphatase PrpC
MGEVVRRPRDNEIDVKGLTHPGKVRSTNQDHFLIASLHKRLKVHATSLPHAEKLRFRGERLAFMTLVADGVGGHQAGEEASRLALEKVAKFITESTECYYTHDPDQEQHFLELLHRSVMKCHDAIAEEAKSDPSLHGMATTLTLVIGSWPWAYVVQVGDSRCYLLHDGELAQLTRDQTVAQDLLDEGIISDDEARKTAWANVLSSAIGDGKACPVTTRAVMNWGDRILICSDGLTRHVSDERIKEILLTTPDSKASCEALVQDALDGGGEDNITVVVGRADARSEPRD